MPLNSKVQYALDALLYIAVHQSSGPVSLSTVSRDQQVSLSYLEHLASSMRRHGLLTSLRGPGGGYTLSRSADAISALDVIEALEGTLRFCADDAARLSSTNRSPGDAVTHRPLSPSHGLWSDLSEVARSFLSQRSIGQMIKDGVLVNPTGQRKTPITSLGPNSIFDVGRRALG